MSPILKHNQTLSLSLTKLSLWLLAHFPRFYSNPPKHCLYPVSLISLMFLSSLYQTHNYLSTGLQSPLNYLLLNATSPPFTPTKTLFL